MAQRWLDLTQPVLAQYPERPGLSLIANLALKALQQIGWIEFAELFD